MSPPPVTRVARVLLALAGIAIAPFFLLQCGEEEEGRSRSRRVSSQASANMPEQWPIYTKGLLAELKKTPQYAEELAAVPDTPQALWLYWNKLLTGLQREGILCHVYVTDEFKGLHPRIHLQGDSATQERQTRQIQLYIAFRDKLEDAIIRHSELDASEAKHTKELLFPALWNAYVRPN